jgi:zinc protease
MSAPFRRAVLASLLLLACASPQPTPKPPVASAPPPPADAWRDTQPPPLPSAPPFSAPVAVAHTLPNRLGVLLRENHAVPVVVVELAIRTGVDGDPPGRAGLADFLGDVLDEGTKSRTADQVAAQLEDLAAFLSISTGLDGIRLHLNCLSETLQPALELLADVALNPAFRSGDVERVRGQILTSLQQRRGNPGALASDEVARLLYGAKHPWGQPAGGTPESVKAIRREDLVRFHDTYFRPNNALLSVSGDFEPARILPLLSERFGAWRPRTLPPSRLPAFPKEAPRTVITVDLPEGTQSQLALATRTLPATHPDALALSTANAALGGLFTSRLNHQLREVKGWTYGLFSSVGFNKRSGVFQVRGSVQAPRTIDSLKEVEAVMGQYATGDITEKELAQAKEAILESLPSALETNDAVASTFVTLSVLGRPLDYYATLPRRLGALSRDEVARVAKANMEPGRLPVVVVGPRKDQEGLATLKLGPVVDRTQEARGQAPAPPAPVPAAR